MLSTAGCALGPNYRTPHTFSSASFASSHGPTLANSSDVGSLPTPIPPDPSWWRIFGDPELTSLEGRVAAANLSVREATFRLVESRAQRQITASALYPSLQGTGQYTRTKLPNRLIQRALQDGVSSQPLAGPQVDGIRQELGEAKIPPIDLWQDGIDASYELDLWGSVRRQVESASADLEQSADQRRSALISAEAELARDYVELRGQQTLLQIQRENLKTAQDSLTLTRQRYFGGLTTDLDVQNAVAQMASIQSQIPNLEQQITQEINAVSLLLGEPPQALASELASASPVPPVPPRVPVGVPSELVLRRPDVRAAADQLHAATAQIGVAIAAFYPTVTLTGNLNELSLQFRDLFTWQSAGYSFGPSITLPLFEGGKLRGQLRLTKAQQGEAAVNYEQTVLQAWHDVDNALTSYAGEQQRRDQLALSVDASRRALALAQSQYVNGLTSFLNVLDAERTLLSAQQQYATSTTTVSSNLVQLYTALGGGWEQTFPADEMPSIAEPATKTASLR
jgi:NodT family efflux transporter outer membrane factor (OMF) lipoprotein